MRSPPNATKTIRRLRWAVAGLTLLAAALRAYHLGLDSYWLDEATSLLIARSSWRAIWHNLGQSSKPPLFYALLKLWLPLGASEGVARLLPLFFGVLSIPAQYWLGRVAVDRRVGVVSAALLALSPFHVTYSQELRMYTLQGFLLTLAFGCFLRALNGGRERWWAAFAATAALAATTHYFSLYALLFLGLYGLWQNRDRRTVMMLGLCGLVVALALLPQLGNLLDEVARETGEGYPPPAALAPLTTLYFLFLSYTVPSGLFLPALFAVLSALALAVYESIRRPSTAGSPGLLLWMGFGPLAAVYLTAALFPLFLPERTLIIALPPLLILLARGLVHRPRPSPTPIVMALLVLVSLISLGGYYWNADYRKPPMRRAAAYVDGHFEPGDVVLHTGDGSYIPFLVYPHPEAHFLLRGDPLPRKEEVVYDTWDGALLDADALPGPYRRLWLVVALDHSLQFQRAAKAGLDARFPLLKRASFDGINVLLYDLERETVE
jgi:uncharacterized membrane protein